MPKIKVKIIKKDNATFSGSESKLSSVLTLAAEKLQVSEDALVEISVLDEDDIRALNRKFRHINLKTDVLSFPIKQFPKIKNILGDIVICPAVINERDEDVETVILHGFLHLLGYDHEKDLKAWNHAEKIIA